MQRYFNTEGRCRTDLHYMVRLDNRMDKIKRLFVDRGKYFVINRGRQYGKTTMLMALAEYLRNDYAVISMDFQMMSSASFADEQAFVISFIEYTEELVSVKKELKESIDVQAFQDLKALKEAKRISLDQLFRRLSRICSTSKKQVVLIIDEVDRAANNEIFLDFLAMLRRYYLDREDNPSFYSVILAGVYDIKNLKIKFRSEGEHKYNSPWNIAASFDMNMSFPAEEIGNMLNEYESERHTGMDIKAVSQWIYEYSSGYPYLVSAICKLIDEEIGICKTETFGSIKEAWTKPGIAKAVNMLLTQQIPLFQSMMRQLNEYSDLKRMLNALLLQGKRITFNPDNPAINLAFMFGYIVNGKGSVQVANRIFEMRLYNYFLSEEELTDAMYHEAQRERNQFIKNQKLDMKLVLEKFVLHFTDIYRDHDERFVEEYGRKFFLLYLKPIINGTGNYYIESETRDARRTDVIVDYLGQQFIIELKIWHGNEYQERGGQQLVEYLDFYHQKVGYLLSFNFNKKKEKGAKKLQIGEKTIIEAVV